jgi:hypothetical protein
MRDPQVKDALLRYESQLKQCNPLPDAPAAAIAAVRSPGCAQFRMPVANPAIGTDKAIDSEQKQRDQLNKLIASDDRQIANLNTIARDECNGVSGTGCPALSAWGRTATGTGRKPIASPALVTPRNFRPK